MYVGAGGGGVLLLLLSIANACCCRKHGKSKRVSKGNVNNGDTDFDGSGGNGDDAQLLDLDLLPTAASPAALTLKQVAQSAAAVAAAAAATSAANMTAIHRPVPSAPLECPKAAAAAFLRSLDIPAMYLDPSHDRCYCKDCYSGWETIDNEGPTPYVVPEHGWVRFGLRVEARAQAMDIFNQWSACFHGVKSVLVLKSVLKCGGLVKPGDRLVDGTLLNSTKCAGRQDKVVYTSPTIKYAGLKFYAEPNTWFDTATGANMCASIVLQCRQNPGTFTAQGETMGFTSRMPGHLEQHCPNVNLTEIEWKTEADRAVIPYGLLLRVWPEGADPDAAAYTSPVDTTLAF